MVLTKPTQTNSIHQRPYTQHPCIYWRLLVRARRRPYIIMARLCPFEIDLLFKVTRVAQCVFTTV